MREVVNAHVERVAQLQAFDVVDELANPLTAMLTLDYFGLPTEDWELYVKPVHEQAFLKPGDREFPRLLMDIERAQAKLRELIAERRKAPGSDLVSVLIATEDENGVLLSDDRIVEVIWVVFGGGFDTTSSLIAHILRYLSENPERKAVLVGTPSLLPSAVDEFVRYFAPAVFSGRTVTEDVTVGGVRMAPGDRVLLSWAASNFDEDAFPVPYEIQFDRKPNRHLSFGWGVHRCPGANFARQELVMVLESILELMPDLVVDGDAAVPLPNASVVNGYISMPATTR
ncbi:cytochrome P450 [Rhodococcus ruber]|uniref:Cytochrome P450 n=2 Tax=Rhodococcus ruber TaxID=1830 RepID=A0ABT4MER4_9NOCA|nr:cytochrome P450 [Rhodococcus ruber]MCZ4519467.1 cytochrome P450 [Rhodococcus ruber]